MQFASSVSRNSLLNNLHFQHLACYIIFYCHSNGITVVSYNIHCFQEELEDTKRIIRIRKSKDRQHMAKKKKDKRSNNDLQNTTQKTKDRITRTPLKAGVNSSALEG